MADNRDDSISLHYTEKDIESMTDSQKLTIVVRAIVPMHTCLFGNGKIGLKQKVEGISTQVKLVWGILVAIAIVIVGEFFKR